MSLKQSQAPDPRAARGRSRRLALPLALLPALAALSLAAAPVLGDDGTQRRAAGDGRGLTTFGSRALTTFGDRGLASSTGRLGESFSQRGLTSFSDLPLAPMGGLIPGGVTVASDPGVVHHRCHHGSSSSGGFGFLVPGGPSQASLRADAGDGFDSSDDGVALLMPAVELPTIVFDHRPAAALMDATLDAAVRAATEDGDLDLARSLDPDRR